MRIATLFSGIGAPEQAAKRVYGDFDTVFACEYDKFARASYKAMYDIDPAHFHKDVRDMDATPYRGMIDILIGGSPCQSFSIAGLRGGTNDERGKLIYQYIRIVEECMPEIIIYENVKGMLSIDRGRTVKDFIQALRDIGYHCHYEVLNTKDYGVPQNRERLFMVGFLDHSTYMRFEFAEKEPLEKRLKDVIEDDVDEKYYLSEKLIKTLFFTKSGKHGCFSPAQVHDINSYSSAITARYYKLGRQDQYINVVGKLDIEGNDKIKRVYGDDGVSHALQTMQGGNREPKILVKSNTKKGYEEAVSGDSVNISFPNSKTRRGRVCKQVAQTLDTQCNQAFFGDRIRRLTPLECWRLQDFPDEAFHKAKNAGLSDTQLYKQAGNSMSVNVLEMIFNKIEKAKRCERTNTLLDFVKETA